MVRDQAAVRLAGPGAAHQGAGRLAVRPAARRTARVPEEVPTISVEPPRNPQQMDKAVTRPGRGPLRVDRLHLASTRSRPCARSSRSTASTRAPSPASRSPRSATRPPPRSPTGACAPTSCRAASSRPPGCSRTGREYDDAARPDRPGLPAAGRHRHREPRRRAWSTSAGRSTTSRRTAPCGPRRRRRRSARRSRAAVRRGRLHVVLDGAQPGRHRRQAAPVDGDRGDRPGHGQDRRGARAAGRRPGRRSPTVDELVEALADFGAAAPRRDARGRPAGDAAVRAQADAAAARSARSDRRARAAWCRGRWPGRGGCARTGGLRRLVAETRLAPPQLVLPVFVREGADEPRPIASMPGVVQHTRDSLRKAAHEAVELGSRRADAVRHPGGQGRRRAPARLDPAGILNRRDHRRGRRGRRRADRDERPVPRRVHRPRPLRRARRPTAGSTTTRRSSVYAEMALAQADAGVDMVGPSGMMDGQVGGDPRRPSTPPGTPTSRSWPTPRSTPPRSTGRSARPSTPRCRATGAPTSRTPPTPVEGVREVAARRRPRAPTW